MPHNLSAISYFVDDYDSAIDYFTHTLGFTLSEDKSTGKDSRFVLVTPRGSSASILLMRASNEEERALIGKQAADRVFMILASEDFWRDYDTFKQKGVEFLESPREEPYGTVAIFRDKYANKWDLIQPTV